MPDIEFINTELALIESTLTQFFKTINNNENNKLIYQPIQEFVTRKSKRIRPLLTLLCAQTLEQDVKNILPAALSIELFHNFTLIHDDIEDNSHLRRGKQCLHITHGIPVALNAGDGLLLLALKPIFDLPQDIRINALNFLLTNYLRVFEGQAIELSWITQKSWNITEQDYLHMIECKTGTLIGSSCGVSALIAGSSQEHQDVLYSFGLALGMAYQIHDDIKNITSNKQTYSKDWACDITEGKRTLMVIYTLNSPLITGEDKQKFITILDSHTTNQNDITWAIDLMNKAQAIEYAITRKKELVDRANKLLQKYIPLNPGCTKLISLLKDLLG